MQAAKQALVVAGTDRTSTLMRKHGVKLAFGTDILLSERIARRQGAQRGELVRWFTSAEVLRMATGTNGELLALSGPRNPYLGKIGVIEPGALADRRLLDGDPAGDIRGSKTSSAACWSLRRTGRSTGTRWRANGTCRCGAL